MTRRAAIVFEPSSGGRAIKDRYAEERLQHALRFAIANRQAVVISGDGTLRLDPPVPELPPFTPDYKGWIYAIQVSGYDLIKIGYSTNPDRRLLELAAGSGMGEGLIKLFQLRGDGYRERELHRRFAAQRLYGEWFRLEGSLAEWIAAKGQEVPA